MKRTNQTLNNELRLELKVLIVIGAIGLLTLCGILFTTSSKEDEPSCNNENGGELLPFGCDGSLFIFQKTPSSFYTVAADGSLQEFGNAENCPDGKKNLSLNGIGFRASDGLIYGLRKAAKNKVDIYQVGAEGRVKHYATIEGPGGTEFIHYIGEIGGDTYYIAGKANNKKILFTLDLNEVDKALAQKKKNLPKPKQRNLKKNFPGIHDWAFNPLDGKLYSLEQNTGKVVVLDIEKNPVEVEVYQANGSKLGPFGAIYFGGDGSMYASQNNDGKNSKIYLINYDCPGENCGKRTLIASSPKVSQNDGASCTASVPVLKKKVFPRFALPGDTLTYTFTYLNSAPRPLSGIDFYNELPKDLKAAYLPGSLSGELGGGKPNKYDNKKSLSIAGITIPAKNGKQPGRISFQVQTIVPKQNALYGKHFESQANFNYNKQSFRSSDQYLPPGSPTPVDVVAPFELSKSLESGKPIPGEILTYRISLSNPANGGNYDGGYRVNITDSLQHGTFVPNQKLQLVSSNPDFSYENISISSQSLMIEGIKLMAGDEVYLNYEVQVPPDMKPGESIKNTILAQVPQSRIQLAQHINQGVFPVEFLYVDGRTSGESVQLVWATAREMNNKGFEVQYSADGRLYEKLGFVEGKGTTTEMQEYEFQTTALPAGDYLFRLKQVDLDGKFAYSQLVEIRLEGQAPEAKLRVFPNPIRDQATISVEIPREQHIRIEVLNLAGQVVNQVFEGVIRSGQARDFRFEAGNLPNGFYFIQVKGQSVQLSKKVLLKR